jgi:hypothetical protein
MPRPRKVDDGKPYEVGAAVRHNPTGYVGAVTHYDSERSRRVDWRQAPPGENPPAMPERQQDIAQLEPVDDEPTVPAFVPELVQRLLDRFRLVESDQPNPTPRAGERGTHRQAVRRWTGTALGCDDGYDWMTVIAALGWTPNPNFGDWPCVVECLKVHDPKDDPDESGRFFRYYRLTYLERSVHLAEYAHYQTAKQDAWPCAH